MLGGIVAAAILDGLTPGPLAVSVGLAQGTNTAQGLFIEMFTTAALTMSVLMLAAGESIQTLLTCLPLSHRFRIRADTLQRSISQPQWRLWASA